MSLSDGQPCKKQKTEATHSVLTFFSDGTFEETPVTESPTDSEMAGNKKQFTTVFASDGRFVHLQKPYAEEPHKNQKTNQAVIQTPPAPVAPAVSVQPQPTVQVWSTRGPVGPENPLASQPAPKSWLESRLERAKPPPDKADSSDSSDAADTEVTVEMRVAHKSPGKITERAARLRINAKSTVVLGKVLGESMGGLLSAIKPE